MPIHDLGYRAWPGKHAPDLFRFWVIAAAGIGVVARNTWVRRGELLAAWLPTFGLAAFIFGYERLVEQQGAMTAAEVRGTFVGGLTDGLQDGDLVAQALTEGDLGDGRHLMWSWLLSSFLRVPQTIMATLVIGMIAPPLIARDMRTRAFLMYFSKPIGRFEYVFGKLLVIVAYVTLITTVPALGCYVFGVASSSDLSVIADTWDLPLRIVLASLLFIIPAASVALMFSSMTSESRFAAFAWFAFWGMGFIAWNVTYAVMSDAAIRRAYEERGDDWSPRGRQEFETRIAAAQKEVADHPLSLLSLYDTLVRLQRWVFGLETRWSAVLPSMAVVAVVTLLSWYVLMRNVSATLRI